MRAVQSVLPCVIGLMMLGMASAAPAPERFPTTDPLAALLRDPVAKQKYLVAVNSSCPGVIDDAGAASQPLDYVTSGGYTVKADAHTVTITDPLGRNTVEHWGDPHENLNGKHLKDWGGGPQWEGLRRTVLLGDGSKITMEANGPHQVTRWTSIYNGNAHVQFDNCRSRIVRQGSDAAETAQLEKTQYDGETSTFETDTTAGVASYDAVYNEDENFERVATPVPLGSTGGFANPNQVNDLIDDPRLAHT